MIALIKCWRASAQLSIRTDESEFAGAPVIALLFLVALSVSDKTKLPSLSERFDALGSAGQTASPL